MARSVLMLGDKGGRDQSNGQEKTGKHLGIWWWHMLALWCLYARIIARDQDIFVGLKSGYFFRKRWIRSSFLSRGANELTEETSLHPSWSKPWNKAGRVYKSEWSSCVGNGSVWVWGTAQSRFHWVTCLKDEEWQNQLTFTEHIPHARCCSKSVHVLTHSIVRQLLLSSAFYRGSNWI